MPEMAKALYVYFTPGCLDSLEAIQYDMKRYVYLFQ